MGVYFTSDFCFNGIYLKASREDLLCSEMLLNLFSRILLEIGRETQNMTEGRENSNFSSDSESDDESNFENDDNTITNQPAQTYQWKGESQDSLSQDSIITDEKPGPYKELFEVSPEWCKFFWINCLFRLPGGAISGYILAERMKLQKYRCIKFLLSAAIVTIAAIFFNLVRHGVIERNYGLEGGVILIFWAAELVFIYALIRQRRLFASERAYE